MHVFALTTVQVQFQLFTKLCDVNLKFGHNLIHVFARFIIIFKKLTSM